MYFDHLYLHHSLRGIVAGIARIVGIAVLLHIHQSKPFRSLLIRMYVLRLGHTTTPPHTPPHARITVTMQCMHARGVLVHCIHGHGKHTYTV